MCSSDLLDYTVARHRSLRSFMRVMQPWLATMFSARYDNHPEPHFMAAGFSVVTRRSFMGGSVVLHALRPDDEVSADACDQ